MALVLFLGGCDRGGWQPGYYWHLASGQIRILFNCRPIDEVLAETSSDERTHRQLLLIEDLRAFAREHIGLTVSSNYSCYYDTEGKPISWNVSACPTDRFEPFTWTFPIVGTAPYKGFFDKERATAERDELRAGGLDVVMRPVSAYSTLGFFSDPALSTMIEYREQSLADLIFHELTHGTAYVRGHTDFNESLASFVGKTGSLLFLTARYGAASDRVRAAKARRADDELFNRFLFEAVASLDSLYRQSLPAEFVMRERVERFDGAKERYRHMRSRFNSSSPYDGFLDWEVNNARLMSYRRYHNLDIFMRLYDGNVKSLATIVARSASCEKSENPWSCLEAASSGER